MYDGSARADVQVINGGGRVNARGGIDLNGEYAVRHILKAAAAEHLSPEAGRRKRRREGSVGLIGHLDCGGEGY